MDNQEVSDDVNSLINAILRNVEKRRCEIAEADDRFKLIDNKYVTGTLSKVAGVEKYLNHSAKIRSMNNEKEVVNEWLANNNYAFVK